MGGWGFVFGCLLRYPAQLGGSLVTIWLPRLRPAVVRLALLLQALALLLRSSPWATPCSGVSLLEQVASTTAGCISSGRVSVGAGCLGNGGRPSPTEHLRDGLHGEHLESPFFAVPLRYPTRCVPAIPWAGPLPKSLSVSSSAPSSLRLPFQ